MIMDICIVCCKPNDNIFSRIKTESSEWQKWNIQRIIEKHLWWWYLRPSKHEETEQWLCCQCWQELSAFHNFYINVEKQTKLYHNLEIPMVQNYNGNISASVDVKKEEQNIDHKSILAENLLQLEHPKKRNKIVGTLECIKIEELPMVIKSENEENEVQEMTKTVDNVLGESIQTEDIPVVIKIENETHEMIKAEEAVVADKVSMDWDQSLLNENNCEDSVAIENNQIDFEDNKLDTIFNKNETTRKCQTKSKAECGKKYTTNGKPPAKVKCEICGAEIVNKYNLNRHIKMMHTAESQKQQVCPYCSKVSRNIKAHRNHIKYTHTLERKHACNMCDKKFRRPLELKEHLSTHTGEPLYTCPQCPRTFISNANMHRHRKLTHRREWEESRVKKEAKALANQKYMKSLRMTAQNETIFL